MKVPCNRDVLLRNSTETTDPSSEASWAGCSPGSVFWGREGGEGGGIKSTWPLREGA